MMMACFGSALAMGLVIGLPSPSVHGLAVVHAAPFHSPEVFSVRK